MSPSPPPSRALGRAGLQRSGWTVTEKRGNQSSNRFVLPDLPFVTSEASQSGDALVRQTRCQTQVSPPLHPSSPGLAPRPVPGGGTGAGRSKSCGREQVERQPRRTPDPVPAAAARLLPERPARCVRWCLLGN